MKFKFLFIFGLAIGSLYGQQGLPDPESFVTAVRQKAIQNQLMHHRCSMKIFTQTFFYFRNNHQATYRMKGARFRHLEVYHAHNGKTKTIEIANRHLSDLPVDDYYPYIFNRIDDLTNPDIPMGHVSVVGPLSANARQYYDFRLNEKTLFNGQWAYELLVIPKSFTIPLFAGQIYVLDTTYQLAGFELTFNSAVKIFPKPVHLKIRQTYALSEKGFIYPDQFEWEYELAVRLFGFQGQGFWGHAERVYHFDDNPRIPSSVFSGASYETIPTAPYRESYFWEPGRYLALSERESLGLEYLMQLPKNRPVVFPDPQDLEKKRLEKDFHTGFSPMIDPRYNRVEGPFLGATIQFRDLALGPYFRHFFLRGDYGYGFRDQRHKWLAEGAKSFRNQSLTMGAKYYDRIQHKESLLGGNLLMNSLTALGYRYDNFHYFYVRGYEAYLRFKPFYPLETEVRYTSRTERSAQQHTHFGIVRFLYDFKPVYPVNEGRLNQLSLYWNYRLGEGRGIAPRRAYVHLNGFIEHSSPHHLKSHFTFTRYYTSIRWHLPTTRRGSLDSRLYLGYATKSVPRQYLFDLYGGSLPYMMKTVSLGELEGNYMAAMTIEHNFGGAWLERTGLPVLKEGYIDMIPNLSVGYSKISGRTRNFISYPARDTKKPLLEAGIGFGDIYRIARVDFAYRFNGHKRAESIWVLTASAFLFNE